ncbi:hypothetical protein D3C75_1356480 [compost metagenome]
MGGLLNLQHIPNQRHHLGFHLGGGHPILVADGSDIFHQKYDLIDDLGTLGFFGTGFLEKL